MNWRQEVRSVHITYTEGKYVLELFKDDSFDNIPVRVIDVQNYHEIGSIVSNWLVNGF